MAELKTKANDASVDDFINNLADAQQRADSFKLVEIMSEITGASPVMWGGAIIGFGNTKLKYSSGRELDWMRIGFSPRKGKITLYVTSDADKLTSRFPRLGKHKIGKGCIYLNKLSDVDTNELKKLIKSANETL